MTNSQMREVERIHKIALGMAKDLHTNGEIKSWKVEENEFFVSVVVEVGSVSDEGTLAAVICRERCQLFIGKRGGVKYPVSKFLKNGEFKSYYKKWNKRSLLRVSIDQNRH